VTHDQIEAMTMGDRVASSMMGHPTVRHAAGDVCTAGEPVRRGFLGSPSMNLVELPVIEGGVRFGDITIPVDRQALSAADSGRVTVGVRPEDLQIVDVAEFEVDVIEELAPMHTHTGEQHQRISGWIDTDTWSPRRLAPPAAQRRSGTPGPIAATHSTSSTRKAARDCRDRRLASQQAGRGSVWAKSAALEAIRHPQDQPEMSVSQHAGSQGPRAPLLASN